MQWYKKCNVIHLPECNVFASRCHEETLVRHHMMEYEHETWLWCNDNFLAALRALTVTP